MQPAQQLRCHGGRLADRKIAEMPDFVIRPDCIVPSLDDRFVHRRDRGERPAIKPERPAMPEMRVAGEKDRPNAGCQAAAMSVCGKSFPLYSSGTSSARAQA